MFALISFLTATARLDSLYDGLWVSPQGQWIVMDNGGFHGMFNNLIFSGEASRPVDNGGLYGHWWSTEKLIIEPFPHRPDFLRQHPDAPAYAGEIRIVPGQMAGVNLDSLNLNLQNSYQDIAFQGPVFRVGDATKIHVAGHYRGKYLDLKMHENGGDEQGDFQIGGNTYTFQGERYNDRATFILVDKDNGSEAGRGWLVWDPTPDCARRLTAADSEPTDRIRLWVIARDVYINGGLEEMTLAGSNPTTTTTQDQPKAVANPFTGKWKGKVSTDLFSLDAVINVTANGQLTGTYTVGTVTGEYMGTLDKDGTLTMKAYTPGQSAIDITGTLAIDPKSQDLTGTVTQVYQGQASRATFDLTKS